VCVNIRETILLPLLEKIKWERPSQKAANFLQGRGVRSIFICFWCCLYIRWSDRRNMFFLKSGLVQLSNLKSTRVIFSTWFLSLFPS
jgi:hypothetical protein